MADPQTWNAYAYVRGNPLALIDPSGMDPLRSHDDGGDPCSDDPILCDIGPIIIGGVLLNSPPPPPPPPQTESKGGNPLPPGSFPGGETLGLPGGIGVPSSLQSLLGLGSSSCEFGACNGFADAKETSIETMYNTILEHIQNIEAEPGAQSVNAWRRTIIKQAQNILETAGKITQKRGAGSLDKYLMRIINVDSNYLRGLLNPENLPEFLFVSPCIADPVLARQLPSCGGLRPPGSI